MEDWRRRSSGSGNEPRRTDSDARRAQGGQPDQPRRSGGAERQPGVPRRNDPRQGSPQQGNRQPGSRQSPQPGRAQSQQPGAAGRGRSAQGDPGRTDRLPSPAPRPSGARIPPASRTGTARKQGRPRSRAGFITKLLIAVLSLCVFSASAYAWVTVTQLNNSLTTANVFDSERPSDGSVDILLIGMDSRTDAQGNPLPKKLLSKLHAGASDGEINTDTLILVHIPNNGKAATAVSIPRDSYVNIPGYGKHKINSAYQRAKAQARGRLESQGTKDPKQLEVQSNQAGARETIKTVEQLSGVGIDHFAQVNLVGFYDISKAIGGVPVCLKQPVNDKQYSGALFKKGEQTVEGAKALAFVRQRHNIPGGSTDLQRNRRQQAFLASMAHKVLSAGTLTNPSALNRLMEAVRKSVVIDQGWDITGFAQQMQNLTGGAMTFSSIPVDNMELQTDSDGTAVQVDPKRVNEFIRNQVGQSNGHKKKKAPPKPNAQHKQTTVDVRNGTTSSGLAGAVLNELGKKGFTTGDTGNSESSSQTAVHYGQGGKAGADQVNSALGGKLELEPDSSLAPGAVKVYLGTDYSGPGAESSSSSGSGDTSSSGDTSGSGGSSSSSGGPQAKPTPPMPPITADGTTCVD